MQFETDIEATGDQSTVLVIEREQVVRSALHYILRDRYRTFTFASVDEAFASTTDSPDAILIGVTALRGQNEGLLAGLCKRYGDAAVLVLADRSSDRLAQMALGNGAHAMICKPISFDTVCAAVDQVLAAPIARDATSRLIRVAFS